MKVQATTFAIVLNKEIALRVTLEEEAISSYASRAADALAAYVRKCSFLKFKSFYNNFKKYLFINNFANIFNSSIIR